MTSNGISPSPPPYLRDRRRPFSDNHHRVGTPPLPRRRSSVLSLQSIDETRQSAGDFILPGLGLAPEHHTEPSHWHSTPLVFAILPAIGGLFFKDGSAFITDILLLGLAAIFLNWSVRLPWDWYHSAQQQRQAYSRRSSIAVTDEDERSSSNGSSTLKDSVQSEEALKAQTEDKDGKSKDLELDEDQDLAAQQLRVHELMALTSTIVLPALGAYLLHVIRSQLSRGSTGLVSDYNLSIFLLAAEIRPFRQIIRLVTNRTLHLQRVVKGTDNLMPVATAGTNPALEARLAVLETRLPATESTDSKASNKEDIVVLATELRKRYEPRLDALERAVRRYEKRATTLTLLTEQRLQNLETRIQDALSLAAAAAHTSQKPGKIATMLSWASRLMMMPFEAAWLVVAWPVQIVEDVMRRVADMIMGPTSRPKRKPDRDVKSMKSKGKKREEVQTTPIKA